MYHVSHYATSPSVFLNMLNNYSNQELESIASELKYVMIAGESFKRKFTRYGERDSGISDYSIYMGLQKLPFMQHIIDLKKSRITGNSDWNLH